MSNWRRFSNKVHAILGDRDWVITHSKWMAVERTYINALMWIYTTVDTEGTLAIRKDTYTGDEEAFVEYPDGVRRYIPLLYAQHMLGLDKK